MTYLFPAGGPRGGTVEVTASGTFDPWPAKVWVSRPGLTVTPAKDKGKFTVAVAADAAPGVYWLRAHNADGASPLRPFVVGTLPEIVESEPNDETAQAKVIDAPGVVVNGRLAKAGDVDSFAVALKQGQTLVASVAANDTLKSPMDGVLQVVSPGGFVVDQNNDRRGMDSQLTFTAPAAGTYVVRLFAFPATPDSSIRLFGSDACVYRLTITTGGFAEFATPLAVAPDGGIVEVTGWNVPDAARRLTVPKGEPGPVDLFHPLLGNTIRVRRESGTVTGKVESAGAPFETTVAGRKGQPLAVRAESRAVGLDVNPVVRVLGPDGKQLARAEPGKLHSDTALTFTPPADGEYRVAVSDLYGAAGRRGVFLLKVAAPEPDYDLSVPADRIAVPPGKSVDVTVKVARRNGFSKPVEVVAEGLPEGVTLATKAPAGKADPNAVVVSLSAGKAGVSGALRLVGRVAGEPALSRPARAPNGEFDEPTADLWVTVSDTPVSPPPPKKKR
ncbi:PPC domain-containing protein [Urbifossiella limnaea]|uniref:PPC domain-containing protein n=1 Tax=Urbifossiella limnaea TaxID=2528023 RepID=UPI00192E42B6|nr:pre-peptidase C-terminal domain-containing protein [Urbifossiella limnaea]